MDRLVDQNMVIAENVAIGDGSGSPVTKTFATKRISDTPGAALICVKAATAITIAAAKKLFVEVKGGAAGAEAPQVGNAHVYPFFKDSADGEVVLAAGDIICEYVLPSGMIPNAVVSIYSDSDHSAAKVTIIAFPALG